MPAKAFPWQHTEAELFRLWQQERDHEVRDRFHGLWLLRRGWSVAAVADAMGVVPVTVYAWRRWYAANPMPPVLPPNSGPHFGATGYGTCRQCRQRGAVNAGVCTRCWQRGYKREWRRGELRGPARKGRPSVFPHPVD